MHTPTETWITIPEAARLRGCAESLLHSRLKQGHLQGRKVAITLTFTGRRMGNGSVGAGPWRWELRLSDVMDMDMDFTKRQKRPHRGAGGVYSGPVTPTTLDRLMDVIKAVAEGRNTHRLDAVLVKAEPDKDDGEQLA